MKTVSVLFLALGIMLPPGLWRAVASGAGRDLCECSCRCAAGHCGMNMNGRHCPMSAGRHGAHRVTCTCSMQSSGPSDVAPHPFDFHYTPPRAESLPQPAVAVFQGVGYVPSVRPGHARPLELPPKPLA